jgi:hypothetical protein
VDSDRSGYLSERDFTEWLSGSSASGGATKAEGLQLMRPLNREPDFWTAESLRHALQEMLIAADLSPIDLMKAWDSDLGGELERAEFVSHVKKVVADESLWADQLKAVVLEAFAEVSGGDRVIDAVEFHRWLNAGWKHLKARQWLARREAEPGHTSRLEQPG